MRTAEVIDYFGSQAQTARALGIAGPSVNTWGDRVPLARALELEELTNEKLKVRWHMYGLQRRVLAKRAA